MSKALPKPFPSAKPIEAGVEANIEWVICHAPFYGAINGYVRIPEDSGITEENLDDISVHGGVTYGTSTWVKGGWIGFDTLHGGDWWASDKQHFHDEWCKHWTQEQVVEETKSLARQVSEILTRSLPAAAPEQAHSTDDLARLILRRKRMLATIAEADDVPEGSIPRLAGAIWAWQFLTGLDATEENLLAAEERANHPLMLVRAEEVGDD